VFVPAAGGRSGAWLIAEAACMQLRPLCNSDGADHRLYEPVITHSLCAEQK